MARKICLNPVTDLYGWCTERCEDQVLIASWYEIEGRIDPQATWPAFHFLDHFFVHGSPLAFLTLAHINAERKRMGLSVLLFRESDIFDYGRLGVGEKNIKAQLRCQIRDEYLELDTLDRLKWYKQARQEMADLPPPHQTFAEVQQRRDYNANDRFNARELIRRRQVLNFLPEHPQPPIIEIQPTIITAPPLVNDTARLEKQLLAASTLPLSDSEALIAQLASRLTGDQAFDLLDRFDHTTVKAALLRRSMEE